MRALSVRHTLTRPKSCAAPSSVRYEASDGRCKLWYVVIAFASASLLQDLGNGNRCSRACSDYEATPIHRVTRSLKPPMLAEGPNVDFSVLSLLWKLVSKRQTRSKNKRVTSPLSGPRRLAYMYMSAW